MRIVSVLVVALVGLACREPKLVEEAETGFATDPSGATSPTGATSSGTTATGGGTSTGSSSTTTTDGTRTAGSGTDEPPDCSLAPPLYDARLEASCASEPRTEPLSWTVEWEWRENTVDPGYHQVMMTPAVGPLVDTDGDGDIDSEDAPAVVFTAFMGEYRRAGAVVALRGDTGELLWSTLGEPGREPWGSGGVALGDLDGTGPVVVVPSLDGLLALNGDGSVRWSAATPVGRHGLPYLVDLEGDGVAEVIFGNSVVDADGTVRWVGAGARGGEFSLNGHAADLDGDGLLEVVAGGTVYEHDGSIRWQQTDTEGAPMEGFSAVTDLDGDGALEVIVVNEGVHLFAADGTPLWHTPYDEDLGGSPIIGDLDGDGGLEIGVSFREGFRTLDHDGVELWSQPWVELGGENGGSAFDFDGDGVLELVFSDQESAYVVDGSVRSTELIFAEHSSGTLYEMPIPVDLDGDGSVELLVSSNDYSRYDDSAGLAVLGASEAVWPNAPKVWNQHHYWHGAITEDGRIPSDSAPGQSTLRVARSSLPAGLQLPNLVLGREVLCLDQCDDDVAVLWLPIESTGSTEAGPTQLVVTQGGEELVRWPVGTLAPGAVTWVGPIELTRSQWAGGIAAHVDAADDLQECLEDDNLTEWDAFPCL